MKKSLVSLFCVLALILSLSISAFALGSAPSSADFDGVTNFMYIEPKDASYLTDYAVKYVNAPKGHSINVFGEPSAKNGAVYWAFHGSPVTVLAEQNGFSCVQFYTDSMKYCVGWVMTSLLSDSFPGRSFTIGDALSGDSTSAGEAAFSWKGFFDYKKHIERVAELSEPIENCVGLSLEYQVVSFGDDADREWIGDRTVYVSDGGEWVDVGSFSYNTYGTVHVDVTLPEAMTVAKIAVIADCLRPNVTQYRLAILDSFVA